MQQYEWRLTGKTPMLHHADNIGWADAMDAWKNNPDNKKKSKAGDDRTPAFRWLGNLYHDGRVVCVPTDNLRRMAMEGGALVPVPGGKNGKTFKAQTQSGMLIDGEYWPLLVNGKEIPVAPLLKLQAEENFVKHLAAAEAAGFRLLVKRAPVQGRKHVRVRPIFDNWAVSGLVHVLDDQITGDVLTRIVEHAGLYKGLCDWRPGSKTPGPYGMFTATVTKQ